MIKEKCMTLYSIKSIPCSESECREGKIVVYNVYDMDEKGLPNGHDELCGTCQGRGYLVYSEISQPN